MKRIIITNVFIDKTKYIITIKDQYGNKDVGLFKLEKELSETRHKKHVIYNLAYSYDNKQLRDIIIESFYFKFMGKKHNLWVDDDFQLARF